MRLWGPQREVRIEWQLRPATRRRLIGVGTATGAFGVITGFAVFILLREAADEPAGVSLLCGSLFAAVLIAATIEWLRDQIDRPPEHGHHRRKSFAAILVSIFLLVLFELSIVAYEEVYRSGMERSHVLVELGRKISGVVPPVEGALIVPSDLADPAGLRSVLALEFKSSDSNVRCDAYFPDHANHCVPARRILELMPQLDQWLLFRGMYSPPTRQQFEAAQKEWEERFRPESEYPYGDAPLPPFGARVVRLSDVANSPPWSDYGAFRESVADHYPELSLSLALNRILAERRLYDQKYFAGLTMPASLRGALEQSGDEKISQARNFELNRMLLDRAFPQFIKPMVAIRDDVWSNFTVLFALWLVAAAALGAVLATRIPDFAENKSRAAAQASIAGGLFAVVVVPLLLLLYVFVVRSIRELPFEAQRVTTMRELQEPGFYKGLFTLTFAPLLAINNHHPTLLWVTIAILVAALVLFGKFKPIGTISLTLLILMLGEFLFVEIVANVGYPFSLEGLATVALLGTVVWLAPSFLLGYSVPFLRPGASLPPLWGLIGSAGGGVIVIVTVIRLLTGGTYVSALGWILIAGLLLLTGQVVSREWKIEEYWPLAALAVALIISGLTSLSQKATFSGILKDAHELNIEATPWWIREEVKQNPHMLDIASYLDIWGQGWALRSSDIENTSSLPMQLELCLMGSIGFWLTIGLLAGWSIVSNQESVECRNESEIRCFWAYPDLVAYHDSEHGLVPKTDRELYRRLVLDVLLRERGLRERQRYRKIVQNWRPERIAKLSSHDVGRLLSHVGRSSFRDRSVRGESYPYFRSSSDYHSALEDIYTAKACVDNAKYFIKMYDKLRLEGKSGVDSTGTFVLDEWRARIIENQRNFMPFIKHIRTALFHVWRDACLITFLQGIGLVKHAHFEGCRINNNKASDTPSLPSSQFSVNSTFHN